MRLAAAAGSGTPISARAWPADNWPERDIGLHLGRQFRQPHHVGDVAAALADDLRNVVLAAFEFIGERVIALRLFHRIEIFALHVFDDRDLERVAVADVDRHDRHLVQAGDLRGAPAAFAGDDLEAVLRALAPGAPRSAGSRRAA